MSLQNEYIPPLEQETSEFLKAARVILRTGHSKHDKWTVGRNNDMVLFKSGKGHDIDSYNEDYWKFEDRNGRYSFTTILESCKKSPRKS